MKDIYAKVNKESDMDWAEIAVVHGLDVSSETLRKAGLGVRWAAEAGMLDLDGAEGEGSAANYEDAYKAKTQFYDQRRAYHRELARDARWEHLCGIIRACAQRLNQDAPLPQLKAARSGGDREAVLVLSDWHYGMVTDNLWNKYNTQVCKERAWHVVERASAMIAQYGVKTLHVMILGDMAAGAIHTSTRVAAEENACEQLMHVSELLAQVIAQLAGCVEYTLVYCTYGNHMRTTPVKADSIHADNMERVIPWWLAERFRGATNVKIVDSGADEFIRAYVCGCNVLAVHGELDGDRDAAIRLNTMHGKVYGQGIDYLVTGHVHHIGNAESFGIEHIQVGGLCGVDEFAKSRRLFSVPSQTLMIFDPECGLDVLCNIKLRDKMRKEGRDG